MNTTTFSVKAFLAALAGAALLPVGPGIAALALTAFGLLAMMASDYGRPVGPVSVPARLAPLETGVGALPAAA